MPVFSSRVARELAEVREAHKAEAKRLMRRVAFLTALHAPDESTRAELVQFKQNPALCRLLRTVLAAETLAEREAAVEELMVAVHAVDPTEFSQANMQHALTEAGMDVCHRVGKLRGV